MDLREDHLAANENVLTSIWFLALAGEVPPFGVKVTLIEPAGYETGWVASATQVTPMPEYQPIRDAHANNPVKPAAATRTRPARRLELDRAAPRSITRHRRSPQRRLLASTVMALDREQWDDLAKRAYSASSEGTEQSATLVVGCSI